MNKPKWQRSLEKPRIRKPTPERLFPWSRGVQGVPHAVIHIMLPCPFCGCAAIVNEGRGGRTTRYYAICTGLKCGCSLGVKFTIEAAVKAWNQRVLKLRMISSNYEHGQPESRTAATGD